MPARRTVGRAFVVAALLTPAFLTGTPVFSHRGGAAPQGQPPAQRESYDYWGSQREMIRRGQQAIFVCNGLFTSNRTLDQIYAQELKFLPEPIGTPAGGDYTIDREKKAVAIGKPGAVPVMRAVFREGLGCIILAPDQTFDDIEQLPALRTPPPGVDLSKQRQ